MKSLVLFFAGLIISMNLAPLVYGDNRILIMPKDLIRIAEKNGYEQVDDFYNLPGMLEPCYIYGYKEGDKENSAVFWVKKKNEDQRKVYLFFISRKLRYEPFNVDEILPWGKYGSGLSLFQDTTMTLNEFRLLDDQNIKGPEVRLPGNCIRQYYDGKIEILCKYEGRWYQKSYH